MSSPFKLVHGCPHPADRDTDLLGYRAFSMSGSLWPRTPGSTGTARRGAVPVVACRRDKSVGTHPPKFSGLNTFKVGSTRSLYTSPAHQAYASTRPLPFAPQGSILGSWLASGIKRPAWHGLADRRKGPWRGSLLRQRLGSFLATSRFWFLLVDRTEVLGASDQQRRSCKPGTSSHVRSWSSVTASQRLCILRSSASHRRN